MAELRLQAVADLTGGTILRGSPDLLFREFNFDSRQTRPGELFFAIVARRDGHDFVAAAAERGAAGAVVSRDVAVPSDGFGLVRVGDTIKALQDLARAVLGQIKPAVVGITGSVGKTTTKEFTAALLGGSRRVLKSEGNFNNHIGLALSLLRLEPGHNTAVLEMGMSAPGEIRALAAIAPPDIAVITNISPVHLEFLKTMENIAAAKKEILDGARPGAIAILNGDDPYVEKISQEWPGRKVYFGRSRACDVRAENVRRLGFEGYKFDLVRGEARKSVQVSFLAESSIANLLAAIAVTEALAVPFSAVEGAIQGLKPQAGRGAVLRLEGDITVIDDSYNSNPRALEAALRGYAGLPAKRRVAVLGDMLELGDASAYFHEEAGAQAARSGWDVLIPIGPLGPRLAQGARAAGMPAALIHLFPTSEEARERISALLQAGDLVLVKGSRGIRTDLVVEALVGARKER